jgi:hypothetical protein
MKERAEDRGSMPPRAVNGGGDGCKYADQGQETVAAREFGSGLRAY